jgi:hypothetical protein
MHIVKKELIQLRCDLRPLDPSSPRSSSSCSPCRHHRWQRAHCGYDEDGSAGRRCRTLLQSRYLLAARCALDEVTPLDPERQMVIHIPPTFAEDLASNRTARCNSSSTADS